MLSPKQIVDRLKASIGIAQWRNRLPIKPASWKVRWIDSKSAATELVQRLEWQNILIDEKNQIGDRLDEIDRTLARQWNSVSREIDDSLGNLWRNMEMAAERYGVAASLVEQTKWDVGLSVT
jgi:hypothetical protein